MKHLLTGRVNAAITGLMIAAGLFLTGCESPFEDMSDEKLADSVYQCRNSSDQSPGFAIRCDNYTRECERRRDQGRYVC